MDVGYTFPKKLFEGEKQLCIPLFQRPYSWQRKHWAVLWQDILALHDQHPPAPERKHFIGSVVMHPTNTVPAGVSKFAVIDGQQRLTTLFVLLIALRDVATAIGHPVLAERLNRMYLLNEYGTAAERLKVQPTQADRPALRYLAQPPAPGAPRAVGPLLDAYAYFLDKLTAWINRQPARADELVPLVLDRLSLVSITLNSDDDPYLVFESLNAKGMKLTAADLIRNYLFMRIAPAQQDELNAQYWEPMQAALGEALTEFIRHFLMRNGGNVAQSDVYGAFRKTTERRDVVPVLQEMARFAPTYARLLHPTRETKRPALRHALERLHQTRLTVAYPLLLRLYDQVRHGGSVTEATLVAVLGVLENFALRAFITKRGTGGANKSMQALARLTYELAASDGPLLLTAIQEYLATQNYPSDDEVRAKLLTEPLYHHAGERNARTRLLLELLERALNHKEVVATATLSIEHVLPQTLTPAWAAALGPHAPADHAALVHTLGNLTLTGYNSELSNKSFAEKRAEYARSNLSLNVALTEATTWDASAIRARSAQLAALFLQIHPALAAAAETRKKAKAASIKPLAVWLAAKQWPVKTWFDVAIVTLRACAEHAGAGFYAQLAAAKPHFVTPDRAALSSPKELAPGWYYEGHGSAEFHRQQCRWALAVAQIAETQWRVETVS